MEELRLDSGLRSAIRSSGKNLTRIAEESQVTLSSLWRFAEERSDLRLSSASRVAQVLGLDVVRYLPDPGTVNKELELIANRTKERIEVIGARSRRKPYLAAIEAAVIDRSVSYRRLLAGRYITHELHEHLSKLIDLPNVAFRTTPTEHLSYFTVTDNECLMLLPALRSDEFYGMWFGGPVHSGRFARYFWAIFGAHNSDFSQVRTEGDLITLCEACGDPATRFARRASDKAPSGTDA